MTTQQALVARVVSVLGDLALPGATISMSPLHGGGQRGELHFEPETGPHVIRADAWGETTVVLTFTVDAVTAVRLTRAYGHDLAAINAELIGALEASTNELEDVIDLHIYDTGEEPPDAPERRAVAANRALIERAKAAA